MIQAQVRYTVGPPEDQHGAGGGGRLGRSTEVDGDEEERAHQS